MRGKTGALIQALTGQFTDHHGFLVRTHFDLIDKHDQVTARIDVVIEPFRGFRDLICSIPGISTLLWTASRDSRSHPRIDGGRTL